MKLLTRFKQASQKGFTPHHAVGELKKRIEIIKSGAGFTLIELLVVIGILGILAAALVATIDPFEQLNKANDTNVKNTSVEFLNANIRWYTTHNAFPWDPASVGGGDCNGTTPPNASQLTSAGMTDCIENDLISDRELKAGFSSATNQLKEIFVTYNPTTTEFSACFKPKSASQKNDPNTKYTQSGVIDSNCPGGDNCYWCAK